MTTGWGLIGGTANRPELLECGVIRLRGSDFAARLGALKTEFELLLTRLEPTSAAVEGAFHGAHARAALQLAHSRGVILATLAAAGLEVDEYSPATVKKSVTGNGRATKDQVRTMVYRLLSASDRQASRDLSDALAVALCHVATRAFARRVPDPGRAASSRSGPAEAADQRPR
jgi:crossover junction endodeoxyribonuclease RuvC